MALFLVVLGVVLLALSARGWARRTSVGSVGRAIVVGALLLVATSPQVGASHTVVLAADSYYSPSGAWNGYRVFLSSPRHASSGSRGECGWEENINGRHFNVGAAANSTYGSSLIQRGYLVTASANSRDDGWAWNRLASNNWGANVHIVTHTNANVGCGNSAQYLLVMMRSTNIHSWELRNQLIPLLDPVVPGSHQSWDCDGLGECQDSTLAPYRAYVELFFHTNPSAVSWFQSGGGHGTGWNHAWRYGYAVDMTLGYP